MRTQTHAKFHTMMMRNFIAILYSAVWGIVHVLSYTIMSGKQGGPMETNGKTSITY
jgi:hypothetical protein